jgi:hypothetical protein
MCANGRALSERFGSVGMKMGRMVCLVAALALPALPVRALAAETPNARLLGLAESLLHYCERADAKDAGRYQEQVARLVKGASDRELAELRKSAEYRVAYDAETDFVGKVDERNASRVCATSVAGKK